MLCGACLRAIAANLPGADFAVIGRLQDLGAVTAPRAARREEIPDERVRMTVHELRDSLMRLCATGFVRPLPLGKATGYQLTEDGMRALEWFVSSANIGRD